MGALEPGDCICVRTGTFFGALIRIATHSDFDHALIYIGGGQVIQATPSQGVHVSPLREQAGRRAVASTGLPVTGAQRAAVVAAARAYLGDPYNFPAIGADALAVLGLHWRFLLKVAGADRLMICSQLVAAAGSDAGLKPWLCGLADPSLVKPSDLASQPWMQPLAIGP